VPKVRLILRPILGSRKYPAWYFKSLFDFYSPVRSAISISSFNDSAQTFLREKLRCARFEGAYTMRGILTALKALFRDRAGVCAKRRHLCYNLG
jgi:hypothetical protein